MAMGWHCVAVVAAGWRCWPRGAIGGRGVAMGGGPEPRGVRRACHSRSSFGPARRPRSPAHRPVVSQRRPRPPLEVGHAPLWLATPTRPSCDSPEVNQRVRTARGRRAPLCATMHQYAPVWTSMGTAMRHYAPVCTSRHQYGHRYAPLYTSMHQYAPVWAPLCATMHQYAPVCTSMGTAMRHYAPVCTSRHQYGHRYAPLCTSMHQ